MFRWFRRRRAARLFVCGKIDADELMRRLGKPSGNYYNPFGL